MEPSEKAKLTAIAYYGELNSKLFLSAALLMIISLPFIYADVPNQYVTPFLSILIIALLAGLTFSPIRTTIELINVATAACALVVFEYFAIQAYQATADPQNLFFLVNQLLSILFLFSLYASLHVVVRRHAFPQPE